MFKRAGGSERVKCERERERERRDDEAEKIYIPIAANCNIPSWGSSLVSRNSFSRRVLLITG
jgi:hypothetical protein